MRLALRSSALAAMTALLDDDKFQRGREQEGLVETVESDQAASRRLDVWHGQNRRPAAGDAGVGGCQERHVAVGTPVMDEGRLFIEAGYGLSNERSIFGPVGAHSAAE